MLSNIDLTIVADLTFAVDKILNSENEYQEFSILTGSKPDISSQIDAIPKPSVEIIGHQIYTDEQVRETLLKLFAYAANELTERKKFNPFMFDIFVPKKTK